jgi:hypothetical protein
LLATGLAVAAWSPSSGRVFAPAGRWITAATVEARLKSRAPTSCQDLAMPNKKKAIKGTAAITRLQNLAPG